VEKITIKQQIIGELVGLPIFALVLYLFGNDIFNIVPLCMVYVVTGAATIIAANRKKIRAYAERKGYIKPKTKAWQIAIIPPIIVTVAFWAVLAFVHIGEIVMWAIILFITFWVFAVPAVIGIFIEHKVTDSAVQNNNTNYDAIEIKYGVEKKFPIIDKE
jgi:hypothetical protein